VSFEATDIWEIEEGFWLKGRSHYEAYLHPECLFVFPEPTGLLNGNGFVVHLDESSPWQSVKTHERSKTCPAAGVYVLSYRAVGTKSDGAPYSAFCSTTYVEQDGTMKLVQHQQTPIDA